MLKRNILTLNVHCLVEDELDDKQQRIANTIKDLDVDVVFLQEAAQTQSEPLVRDDIKADNYGYTLQQLLKKLNVTYHLYFVPIKASFDRFDEGLAVLSKERLRVIDTRYISKIRDYQNWKSRKIFVLQSKESPIYYASTHFGWSDGYEIFEEQVDLAKTALPMKELCVLAGDFNVKPDTKEYQYIINQGFYDTFSGSVHESSPTHKDHMDVHEGGSRIDYVMTTQPVQTSAHKILFADKPVSDHFGVFVKIEQ